MRQLMFIHENFLLETEAARRLYHEYAADNPILDYHNHLPPADIADNRQFDNLGEIWLAGDHYKWRAMRANGCPERYCTGRASWKEKYLAWARTVPHTLGNPLYHWTHLELKRYFGIDQLLDESTAEPIWEQAAEQLASADMSAQRDFGQIRRALPCAPPMIQQTTWLTIARWPSRSQRQPCCRHFGRIGPWTLAIRRASTSGWTNSRPSTDHRYWQPLESDRGAAAAT